jgi:O-antigen ligase
MLLLVPLIAALVPLLITPGLLSHFDITPKIAILQLGVALILLYRRTNLHNFYMLLQERTGRWFAGALAAEWLITALATALSLHRPLSVNGSTWRRQGLTAETGLLLFTLLAAGWLAANASHIRVFLRACTASGAAASIYGIAQYFGFDPWLPAHAYVVGEGELSIVRPPGTMGHADYFAAWLVCVVFLGLALDRLETARWRKRLAVLGAGLAAAAIVLSGTRSAILGLVAGGIVFIAVPRARIRASAVTFGIACAAGLALFVVSPAGSKLRARVHWSQEDALGGARLPLWRDSLHMAAGRPFLGFGPETFATEFPRFESLDLARAYPDFYHESPHNMLLDALTSRGIAGLFGLLAVCGVAIYAAARLAKSGNSLAAPLAAALAGMLIVQQFIVLVFATALYLHLLAALLVTSPPEENTHSESPERPPPWMLPVALAASLLLITFAVRLLVADGSLAVAQRRIAAGDASGAAAAYQTVLRWQLPGAGDDLEYSRAMAQLAGHTPVLASRLEASRQAFQSATRATTTAEDRQNAWYNLATLQAGNDDAAGVEHSLRNAIECAPDWFKPHWTLAQVLELTNRHSEAVAEARAAVERDGSHHPEVTETLRRLEQRRPQ